MTKGIEMYKVREDRERKYGSTSMERRRYMQNARLVPTQNKGLDLIKDMGCARVSTQLGMSLFVMH